jgi:hypothetical protein
MNDITTSLADYSGGTTDDMEWQPKGAEDSDNDADESDDEDAHTRVLQWPPHLLKRLNPAALQLLETGTLPKAGPVVQETYESPKTLWRSSVSFVKEERQEIEWLIHDVLPAGAVVLLSGREGSMKSWLALTMARAVAAGERWLGKPTKQGAVLYLDGEMCPAVLRDRLQGIGPVEELHVWNWADGSFPHQLDNSDLQRASHGHSLIVVDTLRRQMEGLKENSSDDMAVITDALRQLTRHGATVLVLHHAPKDSERQDYRGSTELGAGVDITISLTKKRSKERITLNLETRKTRYSSSADLEIEVTRGDRTPVFTTTDPRPDTEGQAFLDLYDLVDGLRQTFGRDPNQSEIIAEARKRGLGGRDKILVMLKDRDGAYWRSQHKGNQVTYAPLEDP